MGAVTSTETEVVNVKAEIFDYMEVINSMNALEEVFKEFALALNKANELMLTSINVSPDSALYGTLANNLLQSWKENSFTFNEFYYNFDSWAKMVALVQNNNADFEFSIRTKSGFMDGSVLSSKVNNNANFLVTEPTTVPFDDSEISWVDGKKDSFNYNGRLYTYDSSKMAYVTTVDCSDGGKNININDFVFDGDKAGLMDVVGANVIVEFDYGKDGVNSSKASRIYNIKNNSVCSSFVEYNQYSYGTNLAIGTAGDNMSANGCGLVSIANVLSGIDRNITPEELVSYAGKYAHSNNIVRKDYTSLIGDIATGRGIKGVNTTVYGDLSLGSSNFLNSSDASKFRELLINGNGIVARTIPNRVSGGISTTGAHNVSIVYAGKNVDGVDMCYVIDSNNSTSKYGGYTSCMTVDQASKCITSFVDLGVKYS